MAIIKKNELRNMNEKQLMEKKEELQKEMIKVNSQLSTKTTPENPGRIREIKKTISRINTIICQKKRAAPKEQQKPEQKRIKEVKKKKQS